jgi:hypothetical protein
MSNKVKIVGYAKKEFFSSGIEYRNFSPDLVGNQIASNEGTPIFTSGNFNISTNLDGKVDKTFVTNEFTNFMSLDTLNLDDALEGVITKYAKQAKLNLDYSDMLTYALFGSLREYIRVSLENIITIWPASLYIREVSAIDPTLTGDTVANYVYTLLTDSSTFDVSTERIENTFDINYLSGGTIENTFNESNTLRNLVLNYGSYVISTSGGTYQVTNLVGASALTNSVISVTVQGNPFPDFGVEIINYHIKPNETKIEEFFFNLNEFENNLLNRLTTPNYTGSFKVYNETDSGAIIETQKKLTWPVTDGYNIDFNSLSYSNYVNELLEIADINDNSKSNLMVRFLVSSSISEFDSVPDINGTYVDTNGQKMTSTLKIYGREFDEIKKYSDGISYANVVTYDKKNNTPDAVLKNLARILGWELTSSISQIDVLGNFLNLNPNYYEGYSRGYSDAEAEIELWRRIVLNTPWIWKSKGTRKAIEFLFKFIGAPNGLVAFNEHLYVADEIVDTDLIIEMMEYFNDTSDITGLNVDSDGYPKTLPDTPEMYFQKAGLWYRTTGGPTPDIDILEGNNPHIGPYDGGQAYIEQFTNCLVPNFSGGTSEEVEAEAEVNLFTNYGNGTFNECCNSNVLVELSTDHDFDAILTTNINKILDNNTVTETGCTITNSWSLIAALTGETFYTNVFFTGATAPTESDYVAELYNLVAYSGGTPNLSGATVEYVSGATFTIIASNDDCDSELLDTYFKVEVCIDSTFDCLDEIVTGLTSFNVSKDRDDACSPLNALALTLTHYHDGVGAYPTTGDTIYSDVNGINTVEYADGFESYIGGDFTNPNNWIRTDANGIMIAINCPVVTCDVALGKALFTGGIQGFYIDGVSALRNAEVTFLLSDVVKASPLDSVTVTVGGNVLTEGQLPLTDNIVISPNGGTIYDWEALISSVVTAGVLSYKVTMQVISIDDECLNTKAKSVISFDNDGSCDSIFVLNEAIIGGDEFNYTSCGGTTFAVTLNIGESITVCTSLPIFLPPGFSQINLGPCDLF